MTITVRELVDYITRHESWFDPDSLVRVKMGDIEVDAGSPRIRIKHPDNGKRSLVIATPVYGVPLKDEDYES
jgi:hypothetical protein